MVYVIDNNNKQQSLFVSQKLYSVDSRTKKKYKGKEHSHLEIAKLVELSGWAKQKKLQIRTMATLHWGLRIPTGGRQTS